MGGGGRRGVIIKFNRSGGSPDQLPYTTIAIYSDIGVYYDANKFTKTGDNKRSDMCA